MIRIAICDDSGDSINYLTTLLEVFADRINVDINIRSYNSGKSMLFIWEDTDKYADILFLDIEMPSISGIKVAEVLRSKGFKNEIIFYSRSDTKAISGYDVNAFHYIVKDNTSTEKIEIIFRRAIHRVQDKMQEYISFSCAGENRSIVIRSIKYFTISGRVITVHYENDKEFEFYAALGKLEDMLCDKGFIRINRITLINVDFIDNYTSGEVVMKDGTLYAIGRNYRKDFKEEINAWAHEVEV